MTGPFYQDNHNSLYCADFRKNDLPDESVQMVVTSPPYWGLRKYTGEQDLIWGGGSNCEHKWNTENRPPGGGHVGNKATVGATKAGVQRIFGYQHNTCSVCGAWRGAYGLEPTPEMYVQHTVEILREVRRVLRKDGVVFWNIGDSYNAGREGGHAGGLKGVSKPENAPNRSGVNAPNLKPKDLCLIPFRVAIAAQEDGWWVRSVIIWSKPNPMPESTTDRPTESHEYILMLTKSGKSQYWTHRDHGGTREKPRADYRWINQLTEEEVAIEPEDWKSKIKCPECNGTGYIDIDALWSVSDKCSTCNGKKETQLWKRINLWKGHDYYWDQEAVRELYTESLNRWGGPTLKRETKKTAQFKDEILHLSPSSALRAGAMIRPNEAGRNIRSVWTFPTRPYPEAHFAVFPEKLPELCIKAATPEVGCCSKCGAPWARVIERQNLSTYEEIRRETGKDYHDSIKLTGPRGVALSGGKKSVGNTLTADGKIPWYNKPDNKTIGWKPTCKCGTDARVPATVLDPFCGAGTTLWVAKKLNRRAVGYELSEEYCRLTVERIRQQAML